jgi:hypothetical protein
MQERHSFPVEALPKIFSLKLWQQYGQVHSQYAERFWLLALYLTNACRAEETAQARVEDFYDLL